MFEKYQKVIRFEELLSIQKIWDRKNLKNSNGKRISIKDSGTMCIIRMKSLL